jgi:hypothetical protein
MSWYSDENIEKSFEERDAIHDYKRVNDWTHEGGIQSTFKQKLKKTQDDSWEAIGASIGKMNLQEAFHKANLAVDGYYIEVNPITGETEMYIAGDDVVDVDGNPYLSDKMKKVIGDNNITVVYAWDAEPQLKLNDHGFYEFGEEEKAIQLPDWVKDMGDVMIDETVRPSHDPTVFEDFALGALTVLGIAGTIGVILL